MLLYPVLARILFVVLAGLVFAGLLVLSGPQRALAPLLLLVFGAMLLLGTQAGPAPRKTAVRSVPARPKQRKRRRRPATGLDRRERRTQTGSRRGTTLTGRRGTTVVEEIEVPGYEVLERVGSGGMATVYRARRLSDGRTVALKVPVEQYVADARFIRRFHREAEVAQRLDHVNIVRTFEHGSHGTRHFMAMEYVDGRSLEGYIDGRELDAELSAEVMRYVADALEHIHEAGIIHRDIKPGNIMLLRGSVKDGPGRRLDPGAVKLMDFGIASGKILSRLTMTGARVGTPVYMSPEQARGLQIDHRSDIYSLGLVFYEMLTGETPFKGGYEAIVHQQIFQTPTPPRQLNVQVSRPLDAMVMRLLEKDPDDRPTLRELIAFLESGDAMRDDAPELANRLIITAGTDQGVIRVLDTDGVLHSSFGGIGDGPQDFPAVPSVIAADRAGRLWTVIFGQETAGEQLLIHRYAQDGTRDLSFGRYGMKTGEFLQPAAMAAGPQGHIYVLDSETLLVQRFDEGGNFQAAFGGPGDDRGAFSEPRQLSIGPDGSIHVLDAGSRTVQQFTRDGDYRNQWALRSENGGERLPLDGLTVDARGNVYVAEAGSGRIHRINPETGEVDVREYEPLKGEGHDGFMDLGVDGDGNLFAGRRGGHLIRRFAAAGGAPQVIETYVPLVQLVVDRA